MRSGNGGGGGERKLMTSMIDYFYMAIYQNEKLNIYTIFMLVEVYTGFCIPHDKAVQKVDQGRRMCCYLIYLRQNVDINKIMYKHTPESVLMLLRYPM